MGFDYFDYAGFAGERGKISNLGLRYLQVQFTFNRFVLIPKRLLKLNLKLLLNLRKLLLQVLVQRHGHSRFNTHFLGQLGLHLGLQGQLLF